MNLSDRSAEALTDDGKTIKALGDEVDVPGLTIEYGGNMFATNPLNGLSEAVGLGAAIIILLIAFGSVLAMGLPIGTALFGIGTGTAIVLIMRNIVDMPNFTTSAVAMIGLGVGIDYALFIVTRYRESLAAGLDPERSVGRAIDTAGRAVLFAGTTVVISVLGLLLMKTSIFKGSAIAIAIGVLVTMLASVTLLPALLGFVGRNIDKFGLPHRKSSHPVGELTGWQRWSKVIQRRPWPAAIIALAVLLLLTIPLLSMRLGFTDAGNNPTSDTTRRAYDLVAEGFGPGFNGPLLLAANTPNGASDVAALTKLSQELNSGVQDVAFATPPQANADRSVAVMQVFPKSDPQSEATSELVSRLRDDLIPAVVGSQLDVKVGGITAASDDFAGYTANRLPDLHRRRVAALVPAAHGRVPQPARAAQGRHHEHAVDRRRVRRGGRGVPVGVGCAAHQRRALGPDRSLGTGLHLRRRVRPVDGLRGVPALADPGGVRPHRQQRRRGRRRLGPHRTRRSPPPPRSWCACSAASCSDPWSRSRFWVSASRSRCSSTPPSFGSCSCPPRWSCWATGTGGCRSGSTASCRACTWRRAHTLEEELAELDAESERTPVT